jgi:hypothetical protein
MASGASKKNEKYADRTDKVTTPAILTIIGLRLGLTTNCAEFGEETRNVN